MLTKAGTRGDVRTADDDEIPGDPDVNAGMCWLQGGDNVGMAVQLVDCWGNHSSDHPRLYRFRMIYAALEMDLEALGRRSES